MQLNTMCANTTGALGEKCRIYASLVWQSALTTSTEEMGRLLYAEATANGNGECTVVSGLQCAAVVAQCIQDCKQGITACIHCMGPSWDQCCPCIAKIVQVQC